MRLYRVVPKRTRRFILDSLRLSVYPTLTRLAAPITAARARRWASGIHVGGSGSAANGHATPNAVNPLHEYFDAHREGRGIYKWRHYFDIYHRHLHKFVGRKVNVLEIGVYAGGSLGMWRDYFGPQCRVFAVDVDPGCKAYENEWIKVFIGDQADRVFWRRFREQVPTLDVVIDDGGHRPFQQIATLEETLPYLTPGGVYICEDVHGVPNRFIQYASGIVSALHATKGWTKDMTDPERDLSATATPVQAALSSAHFYPYVLVIEKNETLVREFVAARHGTQWRIPEALTVSAPLANDPVGRPDFQAGRRSAHSGR